jgi:hypothetical protein
MPKFKVHVFEEVRLSYIVEAESAQEAVHFTVANFDGLNPIESEFTGDYSDDVCVDPLLEDGSSDLENYQWLKISEGVRQDETN